MFLFHSGISAMLNIGLLSLVLLEIIKYGEKKNITINNIEVYQTSSRLA